MQIHLRRNGKTVGPYSLSEVERQLSAGEIAPDTLAWHDGLADWRPAEEIVAQLTGQAPTLPAPLPPPVYAGFWWRVLAAFIDSLIVGALGKLLLWKVPPVITLPGVSTTYDTAFFLVAWLYFALLESSSHQATVGKLACGLRVTDERGKRIGFGRATGRHFGMLLCWLTLGVGFLMVAWTRRKQGLHDLLARTLVVRVR